MNLSDLSKGERIEFDIDGLRGQTMRVSDVESQDIGIAEVTVVTLVSGCCEYVLKGVDHSGTFVLTRLDDENETEVERDDIEVQ